MHKRSRTALGALTALALALGAVIPAAAASTATYEVTITNHGRASPSPRRSSRSTADRPASSTSGSTASLGIQELAENGNGAPLLDWLGASRHVTAVRRRRRPARGTRITRRGPWPVGFGRRFTIETSRDGRFLSWASMLICTNDGFTGVSRLKLPARVGAHRLSADVGL